METDNPIVQPKRRGRPPKVESKFEPKVEAKAIPKASEWGIENPNWDNIDVEPGENVDRYALPKWFLEKWSDPKNDDSASFRWVMDSVLGQHDPHWRSKAEQYGWTPVTQKAFGGDLDGLFMRKGAPGEINVAGLVLMVRKMGLTNKARRADKKEAYERVLIREAAWKQGDVPGISLDAQHKTAVRSNFINKSYERVEVPED